MSFKSKIYELRGKAESDITKLLKDKTDQYFDFAIAAKWWDEVFGAVELNTNENLDFKLLLFFTKKILNSKSIDS